MTTPYAEYTTISELRAIEHEWRTLAALRAMNSYFTTPDWILSWMETVPPGEVCPRVAIWRSGAGELAAIAPLMREPHRLHPRVPLAVRPWSNLGSGTGAADHCGWPVLPNHAEQVTEWLTRVAQEGSLLLRNLDPDTGERAVPPGSVPLETSACPRLDIPADPEEVGASSKFRKQLRSYDRKASSRGITFRWVPPEDMSGSLLTVALDLHEKRRREVGWTSTFTPGRADLHRNLIGRSEPGRGPAMVLAEQDGTPVGVLYGFLWNGTFAYYQTGWESSLADINLATLLVTHAIRLAGRGGAQVFDFLRGAEAYKYRFGATDRVDTSWIVPSGLSGRLLAAKFDLKRRREFARQGN